jgi:hypothetical protein
VPATGAGTQAAFARLFEQALRAAGRQPRDIGWVLPTTGPAAPARERLVTLLAGLFETPAAALPVARTEAATGLLGPAGPLVDAGLAAAGLEGGRRLVWNEAARTHDEQALHAPTVMLLAWAPGGSCVIVLLERGQP